MGNRTHFSRFRPDGGQLSPLQTVARIVMDAHPEQFGAVG
jgi:hypothetical protein